jgi:hypothetical protein
VFEGGGRLIERCKPIVQFDSTATEADSLFDLFRSLGYSGLMYLGNRYRPLSDLASVPHRKFGLSGHRDFLFFPQQALGKTIPQIVFRQFPI